VYVYVYVCVCVCVCVCVYACVCHLASIPSSCRNCPRIHSYPRPQATSLVLEAFYVYIQILKF